MNPKTTSIDDKTNNNNNDMSVGEGSTIHEEDEANENDNSESWGVPVALDDLEVFEDEGAYASKAEIEQLRNQVSELQSIMERMALIPNDNDNDGNNDKLYSGNLYDDDQFFNEVNLPTDTYSLMIVSPLCSFSFLVGVSTFAFQMFTFLLVLANTLSIDDMDNPAGIPVNVSTSVRLTQLVALIITIITQDDIRAGLNMFIEGYRNESLQEAFPNSHYGKYLFAIGARLFEGGLGIVVTFLLIVTSSDVVDLLLNFTAMEFVSQLDEVSFFMCQQGFVGTANQRVTDAISQKTYRTNRKKGYHQWHRSTLLLFFFAACLGGWLIVAKNQTQGAYLCTTIYVQYSDEMIPDIGLFSGLYDLRSTNAGWFSFVSNRVEYVERRSQALVFGYCDDLGAWTLYIPILEGRGPCDWIAKSPPTATFDLTETTESGDWTITSLNGDSRETLLDPFFLACFDCDEGADDLCNGHGICNGKGGCVCDDGFYGLRCEFLEPCEVLEFDNRFALFQGLHEWSTTYTRLKVNNQYVDTYDRPIYVNEYSPGQFDIIAFTGRRWVATYTNQLTILTDQYSNHVTKEILQDYFGIGFHSFFSNFTFSFTSEPLDIGSFRDRDSPVGIQWSQKPAQSLEDATVVVDLIPVPAVFLCAVCEAAINECYYDGVCVDGTCECSIGSSGVLCQIPPVGNGRCDVWYNTLQYEYDGGDCCENTCVSSEAFTCGLDESGFTSLGYSFCNQYTSEEGWILNGDTITGGAASGFGFVVGLSDSGAILVVSAPLIGYVRLFDKVGKQWIQRGSGIPSADATTLAVSGGVPHMFNNPFTKVPITIAIPTSMETTGSITLYTCSNSGCDKSGDDLVAFEDDEYGNVVLDISFDGGIIAAGWMSPRPPKPNSTVPDPLAIFYYDETSLGYTKFPLDYLPFKDSEQVVSVSLSNDGFVLVAGLIESTFTPGVGVEIQNYIKRVYAYDPSTGWKQKGSAIVDLDFHPGMSFYVQGKYVSISDDGNVFAYGVWMNNNDGKRYTRVIEWNESIPDWVQRGSPLRCKEGDFELQGTSVALNEDGSIIAMSAADYNGMDSIAYQIGLNGTVCSFFWNGTHWGERGGSVQGGHASTIALSSDGSILAVGEPFATLDTAGLASVYRLPSIRGCPGDQSLLRISVAADDTPDTITWNIVSNETGEVRLEGGPYSWEEWYASFALETCTNTAEECLIFTIYDKLDIVYPPTGSNGVVWPGGHTLFLEEDVIVSGRLEGAAERRFIGNNCLSCPEGTQLFSMLIQTCTSVNWNLVDSSGNYIFSNDNSEYWEIHNAKCDFQSQTTHWEDTCISVNECFSFSVLSLRVVGFENELGGDSSGLRIDDSENSDTERNPEGRPGGSFLTLQYRLFVDGEEISQEPLLVETRYSGAEMELVSSTSFGNCDG